MAPEQRAGALPDPRADQYGFCAVLQEALRGRVPRWLRRACARGLAADPADRHPSMQALITLLAHDRAAARRRVAVAVAFGGIAAVAAVLVATRQPAAVDPCRGAGELPANVVDRAAAIEHTFAATGLPYAGDAARTVAARLDGWRDGWSAMRIEACRATRVRGVESDDLLDLRMACLDESARRVAALGEVLAGADAGAVEHAVDASARATDLTLCAESKALLEPLRPPADPEARRVAADLRDRLAGALALADAGRAADADTRAGAIATDAAAAGLSAIEAEAALIQGDVLVFAHEWLRAGVAYRRALLAGEAAGHDRVRARAYLGLARVEHVGTHLDEGDRLVGQAAAIGGRLGDVALDADLRYAEATAHGWRDEFAAELDGLTVALAARRKAGGDPGSIADLLDAVGTVLWQLDHPGLARAVLGEALAIKEATFGREHPAVIRTIDLLSSVLTTSGRLDEALPILERAFDLAERTFGPGQPGLAHTAAVLAAVLTELHRGAEAIAHLDRAIAAYEHAIDGGSEQIATLHGIRGYAYANSGEPEKALVDYARALELTAASAGPDDLSNADLLENQGLTFQSMGRLDEARVAFEHALAIRVPRQGPDGAQVYYGEFGLGLVEAGQSHPAAAIPHFERAIALRTVPDADPVELADAQFGLAKVLARRDRARALQLAREARATFAAAGVRSADMLPDVDAWLREH